MLTMALCAQGVQKMKVASFRALPMDMTASRPDCKRIDQNGQVAAIIKMMTTETGFTFEGGTLGILHTKQENGEVWIWLPRASRKITVKHPQLGVLRDYMFPIEIEAERTYEMVLETAPVGPGTGGGPVITQQFLMFTVTPKDAIVTVDDIPWQVTDGVASNRVEFGQHEYRIEAKDYHTEAGKIMVNDPDNTVAKEIKLQPAFGYLKIDGNLSVLNNTSIYVDNANASDALRNPMKLSSGQHKVRVVSAKYKAYDRMVTIRDGETFNLKVDLDANFSTITLRVDSDAEIWVNNEKKGMRSWTGDLEAGSYLIECRQKNHRNSTVQKTITDHMSGETITLDPPTPINGTLVVNSNPTMAKITIDGNDMGQTPKQFNAILIGEHTLKLEKQGYATISKTITIEEGKTLNVNEKLSTGRSVFVKTDRSGDQVYVDGHYEGTTPCELPLSFGSHTIRVTRNGVNVEKSVNINEYSQNGQEMLFEFGRLITITTDRSGDVIMVDGKKVGNSPVSIDLPYGPHKVHAERGKKFADKSIDVMKNGGTTSHHLVLMAETVTDFLKYGVGFATADVAYDLSPLISFGFTVGAVDEIGWFATASSNFNFDAMNFTKTTDANGLVDGYYPNYTGVTYTTRFSLLGGVVLKAGDGPLFYRFGLGGDYRCNTWETTDGDLVKVSAESFVGLDLSAGLQLNLKGFTASLDVLTTNFQTIEVKLGLGGCWKR